MNPQLQQLFSQGAPSAEVLSGFLESGHFPLVDETDVTFLWHGEADSVFLRCWISGLDTAQPFQQLEGTNLWAVTIDLPRGSRIEYKFEVVRDGNHEMVLDALNPVLARDPFGANSVCQGAGYRRPSWTLPDPEARKGTIHSALVKSKAFNESRPVELYLPPRYSENRRYPLLIVHDGNDYMEFAALKEVLDNLITRLEIPELLAVMTQSPDRLVEYSGHDPHADFLATDLLPFMEKRFPLIQRPESRCIMGASFGGVASLHAAWRYPGMFSRLLLQSGSFAFSDMGRHQRGPAFDPVVRFMNQFRERPGNPASRVYMSCGIYESLIYENRSLVPRLQSQGIDVRYEEVRDAHNWENWRDRLRNGLSWLYPGPQWMVYE